ncbi:MAG TPA: ImmA/IrrE family metallo-endopeptidase [Terriglobales bacterium]|jgi:Zn-dependent peptidase ImmA (M78 family)|nr:ImmA/IrrE family metallo-endopeptidase [Terriglobales bacterium]
MLKQIIAATKLPSEFCASLVGVDLAQFSDWMEGRKPVPSFILPELSSVLGVREMDITASDGVKRPSAETITPAVWYKLRDENLIDRDREMVGLIRKLGFFLGQLQQVRGERLLEYSPLFGTVRNGVDKNLPPSAQGIQAARVFRGASSLQHGQSGIGELIRPYFRKIGLLLVESPLKGSKLEGCCFSVGSSDTLTPCLFANSFGATWFRRNAVLMHELCHAIFDLEDDPVALDFIERSEGFSTQTLLNEARAQAFAQEALVPKTVLVQFTNKFGVKWSNLSANDIGRLIAETHVEQKLLLKAALDAGFITDEQRAGYEAISCSSEVKAYSTHALNTREYLKLRAEESPKWIGEYRNTDIGTRSLRVPVRYIDEVIKALNDGIITTGKAAEMAMMEKQTFVKRFRNLIQSPESA